MSTAGVVVHPSAVVDPGAHLGPDVIVGPGAVIEADTVLGAGCRIGPHTVIYRGARLGEQVQVHQGAAVSCVPQDLKFKGEETSLEVGDRTVIREFVTLSRGTVEAGVTRVGPDCLLMAYVHIAHDCQLGGHLILANSVQVAGHVHIRDHVIIGGLVAIHQFVKIGEHAFIGGGMEVTKDVPPFVLANGKPLKYCGLNQVGLRRRGFSPERLQRIRDHYRLFFGHGSLNAGHALARLQEHVETDEDARLIAAFVADATRGIIGG